MLGKLELLMSEKIHHLKKCNNNARIIAAFESNCPCRDCDIYRGQTPLLHPIAIEMAAALWVVCKRHENNGPDPKKMGVSRGVYSVCKERLEAYIKAKAGK